MNHQRRLMLAGAGSALIGLSGCVTKRLYDMRSDYREHIHGFFMTSDGASLVILGQRYHYVFAAPPALVAALKPALHSAAKAADFSTFTVDRNNVVSGYVTLGLKNSLSQEEQALAKEAGFEQGVRGWTHRVDLRGTRYSADRFAGLASQKFSQDYSVYVEEEFAPGLLALKVAATPITVLADGVIALGALPLIPVFWLVLSN
ncbi:hypothetical protein [Pseudacidovorax intermedius]|uniref:hypothetical protein n=1 Tax=Pseudacidovorax intermedius TaxID=433924 RepID=UPI0003459F12|nr:hypothetical protein [Pseudacidovorax intermedius]